MNKSFSIWENDKDYYIKDKVVCYKCKDIIKPSLAVVVWADNLNFCYHSECYRTSDNLKNIPFRIIKSVTFAFVVDELPSNSIFISRPCDSLVYSKQLNNDFMQVGIKIIDKTKFANKDSFEGATIGLIDKERLKELDSPIEDINFFLLQYKEKK